MHEANTIATPMLVVPFLLPFMGINSQMFINICILLELSSMLLLLALRYHSLLTKLVNLCLLPVSYIGNLSNVCYDI